jgi:helicase-like protein
VRRQIDVLICTDAAAEGLNLQTADALVNFDLPWNPMEDVWLTDADIEPLRHTLTTRVREAYQTTLAVPRIEVLNEAAGCSQTMLDYLVIRGIILSRQRTRGADPLFWREIAALEDLMHEPDCVLRVRRIPSAQAHHLSHLLFDITMPNTGDESYLDAPRPLLVAALEAAHRLAHGMKVKKSELSTDAFLARLQRDIERGGS